MFFRPPSYDPCSPSYDPCAASPCNPFPTTSPFAAVSFSPTNTSSTGSSRSALIFEMDVDTEFESSQQPPQPVPVTFPNITPPHSAPALRRTKLCRFYISAAGCKTGRWCNFKHPLGADGDTHHGSNQAIPSPSRGDPVDPSVWENIPDVRDLDPNWGKKSDDEVHPKFRTQPCRNFLLGLCRYGPKCQFIHAPGLFAPGAPEVPKSLPIPPAPVPVSIWGAHPGIGASSPETSPVKKTEQMSLFYRTKPCKFFGANGTCPHGADCSFIHDPKKTTSSSPSWADDDRDLDFSEVPLFGGSPERPMSVDSAAMHDVTNRSGRTEGRRRTRDASAEKQREREREGGIYKPLWRVVGGGVKIGKTDVRIGEEEDDDLVLEYQPHDTSPQSGSSNTLHQPHSPSLDFTYTPFDPAQYAPHTLLRAPSPADAPLEIVMGQLETYSKGWKPAGGRKRRVVTGADLMRALGREDDSERAREKEKPRLTIAVPTPVSWTRTSQQHQVVAQTPAGDDVLDWGDEDEDDVIADPIPGEDKQVPRRARSTPPTPRSSASYLEVPVLPRMSAESP